MVGEHRVKSQEHLRELLRDEGIGVTQATLSRDISELQLVKVTDSDGNSYYAPPPAGDVLRPPLEQLLSTLLVSLDGVGNLLVVRTPAGSANALASGFDRQGWKEVIGTVAGDDTILLITHSERARRAVGQRIKRLAGFEG